MHSTLDSGSLSRQRWGMARSSERVSGDNEVEEAELSRIFLGSRVLPEAASGFSPNLDSLEAAISDCDIVIDTNALLIPYISGADSLKEIIRIYKILISENRVFLPAQVAREFVKNRPAKISELLQGVSDRLSTIPNTEKFAYPILEDVPEYNEINNIIENIASLKKSILTNRRELIAKVKAWQWNDPVNSQYSEVFTSDRIIDLNQSHQELAKDFRERKSLFIPPGYKDSSKEDEGVGDFLIWKTILSLGQRNKKNLVFVSGDEKADWQYRSGGEGFLPRYELVDEYRRESEGKCFYMIKLSKLLEMMAGNTESIDEIRAAEERNREERPSSNIVSERVPCGSCEGTLAFELGEAIGSSAHAQCQICGATYHAHRHSDSIRLNQPFKSALRKKTNPIFPHIRCPQCQSGVACYVGDEIMSVADCRCMFCETNFSVYRENRKMVKVFLVEGIWQDNPNSVPIES